MQNDNSDSQKNTNRDRDSNNDIENNSNREDVTNSEENLVSVPNDKYNLVYLGFMVLGITTVLPWNSFITATDYWMYKFRNVTTNNTHPDGASRTPLQTFFESYLAIASNFALLLAMMLNTLYGRMFSHKKRLYVSLISTLVIFIITTLFVPINTDTMQNLFFGITIVLVMLISSISAVFQSAIFGVVSSFPPQCMHAMVNGQSVAGLLAVLIQVLCLVRDLGPMISGFWYFLASTVFLATAILCYWLMDNEYTRYHIGDITDDSTTQVTTAPGGLFGDMNELKAALKDCWQPAAVTAITFWSTLAVFPGVCVLVVPEHPNTSFLTGRFFIPIVTFLLFNLGDFAGRICSSNVPFPTRRKGLLLYITIARVVLPLLIIFCNVHPRYHTPVLFQSDIYYPILNTLSALTNGYLFSAAMVMASACSQRNRSELTGFIMASSLAIGLLFGSITSTILLRII